MTIGAVVDLTRAELQNKPAINRFESVACTLNTLKRGGLFIAFDSNTIPQALQQGAYGIITPTPYPIIDEECAWLVVDDLEKCVLNLLKFTLLDSTITLIGADDVCLDLSMQIIKDPSMLISSSYCDALEALFSSSSFTYALLPRVLADPLAPKETLTTRTLPSTSPSFHTMVLKEGENDLTVKLSAPYHATLFFLVEYFRSLSLQLSIPSTLTLNSFFTTFVTSSLTLADFGQTHTMIIFSDTHDLAYIQHEVDTITRMFPWGRVVVFSPEGEPSANLSYNGIVRWDDVSMISHWLMHNKWEIALIYGASKDDVIKEPIVQPTLF